MRNNRRLLWISAVSLLVHGLLLSWLVVPPSGSRMPVVLEMVLETKASPEPLVPDDVEPRIEQIPEPVPVPEPELRITEAAPESLLEEDRESERPANPPRPATVLNLRRPDNWDALVGSIPERGVTTLHFNRELEQGVSERRLEKRRIATINARGAEIYGTTDEAYTRQNGFGTETKIDNRCYVKVEDPSVEEGSRWWAGQCTDTQRNPFEQEAAEYDAIGRIVAD